MTHEHLDLIQALDMPFFIVVTKIENASPDATLIKLKSILSSINCQKVPMLIRTLDDVITGGAGQYAEQILPVFCVSNVTGAGLDLLTKFLFVLSPGISNAERERLEQEPCAFLVDEIFKVGDVGPVVGGLLIKGVLTENMNMQIGPLHGNLGTTYEAFSDFLLILTYYRWIFLSSRCAVDPSEQSEVSNRASWSKCIVGFCRTSKSTKP